MMLMRPENSCLLSMYHSSSIGGVVSHVEVSSCRAINDVCSTVGNKGFWNSISEISEKTVIPISISLVGCDSRSRSSFTQSFLSVKDSISLLLITSSSLLNSSFVLGIVCIR